MTEDIALALEEANEELIGFIESCSDADVRASVSGDGWTVAADAYHCAVGHVRAIGWLEHMRRGEDVPGSVQSHDAMNAKGATDFANAPVQETVALLRKNCAEAAAYLRGLNSDELGTTVVHGPAGGATLSVAQMANAFPSHVCSHLERMRAATT